MDLSQRPAGDGSRLRGGGATRLEAGVDVAFRFALAPRVLAFRAMPPAFPGSCGALRRKDT